MTSPPRHQLERHVLKYCALLHQRGWVANHDGNITARLAPDTLIATPTAFSKAEIKQQHLITIDLDGNKLTGQEKGFSELNLHTYVYRQREDVGAVLHSHSPHATALAVMGLTVEPRILPESVVSLGSSIPLIPYAAPKSPASTLNLAPFVQDVDVVTLENHGVLAWGPDLETAYLRMELVEHLATIQLHTGTPDGCRIIPDKDITTCLLARSKAGLGPQGRAIKK